MTTIHNNLRLLGKGVMGLLSRADVTATLSVLSLASAPAFANPSSTSKAKAKRQAIVVLITDGEVADESHILKTIQGRVGDTRVFTVGVDTAVNDGFLKRLASLGGGTSTFVPPGDALENALINVAREIGVPLVTDLHIVNNKQFTCAPHKTIDLFEGRPVSIYFQCTPDKLPQSIEVVGRLASGGKYKEKISLRPTANAALPQLYAKARISELEDLMRDSAANEGQIYEREIVELSVVHSLLTRFTAFLAVDHSEIANPSGDLRKLVQPVETPAQWKELTSTGSWGAAPASSLIRMREATQASPSQMSANAPAWGSGGSWGAPSAGSIDGSAPNDAWGAAAPMPAFQPPACPPPGSSFSGFSGNANSLGARVPESDESIEVIFEAMGVPPEVDGSMGSSDSWVASKANLARDWSKLMAIMERLQKALQSMLKIMASGDGDWSKEFIEFGKLKVALEALSGRNQVVDSHPTISFLLLEKVLPALSSLLNTNGANLSSTDLAYVAKLSLGYIDQVKDAAPPQNKNDFLSFWKNNI